MQRAVELSQQRRALVKTLSELGESHIRDMSIAASCWNKRTTATTKSTKGALRNTKEISVA